MNLVGGRGEEPGTVIFEDPTGQEVDLFVKGRSRKVLHPRTREEVFPAFLTAPSCRRRNGPTRGSGWPSG